MLQRPKKLLWLMIFGLILRDHLIFTSSSSSSTSLTSSTNNIHSIHCYDYDLTADHTAEYQKRKLYILTVQSGSGYKFYRYMSSWKLSVAPLVSSVANKQNIEATILNPEWQRLTDHKFLTKPTAYHESIVKIMKMESNNLDNVYLILVDSDVIWSNMSINLLWDKYECIRRNKDIVVSSELNCWVGRYCTVDDLLKYYSKPLPGYSTFINSGAVIGKIQPMEEMFRTIVTNPKNYYLETYSGYKFDDQYAFVKYLLLEHQNHGTIDIHQELFGTFQIYNPLPRNKTGYICKINSKISHLDLIYVNQSTSRSTSTSTSTSIPNSLDNFYSSSCEDFTSKVFKNNAVLFNSNNCNLERYPERSRKISPALLSVMTSLSHQPLLWHGNGGGKRFFLYYKPIIQNCLLNHSGIAVDRYVCDDNGCGVK